MSPSSKRHGMGAGNGLFAQALHVEGHFLLALGNQHAGVEGAGLSMERMPLRSCSTLRFEPTANSLACPGRARGSAQKRGRWSAPPGHRPAGGVPYRHRIREGRRSPCHGPVGP